MDIVIQKFGGTSVSTTESRLNVIDKIKKTIENGESPVVVVSAMGRKGLPYATDSLLSLVSDEFKIANNLAIDLLMGCGEIISTVVMSNDLHSQGINAAPLTGGQAGIITTNKYNDSTIIRVEEDKILKIIKSGRIPVVAGFQGVDEDGFVTTLGRGGSDTSASILGVALNAKRIEIFTDVDGIMTADPRIVPDASLINQIDYSEIFQFAEQGAKVIHPRAVEIAMRHNIPLIVKNTFSNCEGTTISSGERTYELRDSKFITGITSMSGRVKIEVCEDGSTHCGILEKLLSNTISIDLINVFPKHKIFTISESDFARFVKIAKDEDVSYTYSLNCCKISIIGSGMHNRPGVMADIVKCLNEEKVSILQTADSNSTIWCLIEEGNKVAAIQALHKTFGL